MTTIRVLRVERDWASMLDAPIDVVSDPGEYEVNSVVEWLASKFGNLDIDVRDAELLEAALAAKDVEFVRAEVTTFRYQPKSWR
jgi:hypothetical protein